MTQSTSSSLKTKNAESKREKIAELLKRPRKVDENPDIKETKTKFSFWDKWRKKRNPAYVFTVTMRYSNGSERTFTVKSKQEWFKHGKRVYYLYSENAVDDLTNGVAHLYYDEDVCVPIERIPERRGNESFWLVSPDNLEHVIGMKYVEALTSEATDAIIRNIFTIVVLILGICLVMAYFIYKIKNP